MGTRIPPVQHYNLKTANSFIRSSLHDLNTVDSRPSSIEGIGDVDCGAVSDNSLDDDGSNSVDCLQGYRNDLGLHAIGVEEHVEFENGGSSGNSYGILSIEDVAPIEAARARFLDIIVDHFLQEHLSEVQDSLEPDCSTQPGQDKPNKRKSREIQYEGDSKFVLPLMYVANLYETLVNDVNMRIVSMDGLRDKKTIGVALEAAGGLYRKLAKKFPRKGQCSFRRRELATSLETRTRFPELVIQEEKRVRFVVVNGLEIIDTPNTMTVEDAEWFKRLTGRLEVSVSTKDYKFYSPRHKYRQTSQLSVSNIPTLSGFPAVESSAPLVPSQEDPQSQPKHRLPAMLQQDQLHPGHQMQQQTIHCQRDPHLLQACKSHHCSHTCHLTEITHSHWSPTMSQQHMPNLQPLSAGHVLGRMHVLPTGLAKFCDECGAAYLKETSKFCSECGAKRLGV